MVDNFENHISMEGMSVTATRPITRPLSDDRSSQNPGWSVSPGTSLYSIGHSNQTIDQFLGVLQRNTIETVVDVRSIPYSKYNPHFSKDPLDTELTSLGINYRFRGEVLGGRPKNENFYDHDGHARYDLMAADREFLRGLQELLEMTVGQNVAILCSEDDPGVCHRFLLITRVLEMELRIKGVTIQHIRKDGTVQQSNQIRSYWNLKPTSGQQESLFMESEDPKPVLWRSPKAIRTERRSIRDLAALVA